MPQPVASPSPGPAIPFLKAAVIIMGVLIVIGLVGLGYMVMQKLGKREADAVAATEPLGGPAEAAPVIASGGAARLHALGLPKGSQVIAMTAAEDRLVLNVRVPDQGERIVIIDLRKGGVIGHVALEAGAN